MSLADPMKTTVFKIRFAIIQHRTGQKLRCFKLKLFNFRCDLKKLYQIRYKPPGPTRWWRARAGPDHSTDGHGVTIKALQAQASHGHSGSHGATIAPQVLAEFGLGGPESAGRHACRRVVE